MEDKSGEFIFFRGLLLIPGRWMITSAPSRLLASIDWAKSTSSVLDVFGPNQQWKKYAESNEVTS